MISYILIYNNKYYVLNSSKYKLNVYIVIDNNNYFYLWGLVFNLFICDENFIAQIEDLVLVYKNKQLVIHKVNYKKKYNTHLIYNQIKKKWNCFINYNWYSFYIYLYGKFYI